MTGYSPYELLFGRKPRDFLSLDSELSTDMIPVSFQEYAQTLKDRLEVIGTTATELQNQYQEQQRIDRAQKIKKSSPYRNGDLVYLLYPKATD